jgi:protein-disulfide isomerase
MRRLLIASLLVLCVPAFASDSAEGQACERSNCAGEDGATVSAQRFQVDLRGAPSHGPAEAEVTVVVFSDFQCPFCAKGARSVKALEKKYGNRIRVVFKNQPLPRHGQARLAAAAALAAQEQGHFWELHDWFFSIDARYDRDAILEEAGKLGLDAAKMAAELDSGVHEARISADQAEAKRLGVQGTPTFFINGLRVIGAQPLETLEGIVDAELAR